MSSICFTGNGRRGCTPALLCMYLCPPPVHPPPICYMSVSTLHAGIQAYCILQFRYLLLNSKTHLYRRRNYNVYVHNTAILWTFVRCEQHLFRTTCFSFLPGWHAVVPGCSRLLMSLQHMVSLIVLNVVLIFRRVCGPEQLSLLARVPMSMSSCFRKSTWGKRMYIRLVWHNATGTGLCNANGIMNAERIGSQKKQTLWHWCFCFSRSNRLIQCSLHGICLNQHHKITKTCQNMRGHTCKVLQRVRACKRSTQLFSGTACTNVQQARK